MKYCPNCNERFDEDIIKFCTKDGTPLIEDAHPSFTALPSENLEDDDFGQETIIRRKPVAGTPSERIVIPTETVPEQSVRPRTAAAYNPPPAPSSNTAKTVVLTIFGTLFILACGAGLFWFLQKEKPANTNVNTNMNFNANQNVNLNANVGFDANFNFNASSNANYNVNSNANANTKTPTPTPTPKPSPSVTPSPSPTATPSASPTPTKPTMTNRPAPTPTPRTGPRPPTMTGNKPPGNDN